MCRTDTFRLLHGRDFAAELADVGRDVASIAEIAQRDAETDASPTAVAANATT